MDFAKTAKNERKKIDCDGFMIFEMEYGLLSSRGEKFLYFLIGICSNNNLVIDKT